jgi:hypothetical protein
MRAAPERHAASRTLQPRPRGAALLVSAAVLAALAVSLAWNVVVTVTLLAAAYALLLVAVARAARERLHGTAFTAAALVIGVASALLVPLTWGTSLLLAPIGLPLAVPGLQSPGATRWLAAVAVALNAALTALFALMWIA